MIEYHQNFHKVLECFISYIVHCIVVNERNSSTLYLIALMSLLLVGLSNHKHKGHDYLLFEEQFLYIIIHNSCYVDVLGSFEYNALAVSRFNLL